MTTRPRLLAVEATLLSLPTGAFLAATLPEVLRLTRGMLHLRSTSNPEISFLQVFGGLLYWAFGAFALGVLVWLAVATVRRSVFRYGPLFWLGLAAGLYCVATMYSPFGVPLTAALSLPLLVLAAHCVFLQAKYRPVS